MTPLIAAFAYAFAWFIIAPVVLSEPLPGFPLLQVSEAVDLFAPVVLLPLYWVLFARARAGGPRASAAVAFLAFAALWGVGHGVHLAANSIGHLTRENMPERLTALVEFYDETLGHYLWHTGVFGLAALLAWRAAAAGDEADVGAAAGGAGGVDGSVAVVGAAARSLVLPALAHGTTLALMMIEGDTAPIGIPFAAVLVAAIGRRALRAPRRRAWLLERPVAAFLLASYVVALALIAGWAIAWRGLPEFSEVGIID